MNRSVFKLVRGSFLCNFDGLSHHAFYLRIVGSDNNYQLWLSNWVKMHYLDGRDNQCIKAAVWVTYVMSVTH